MKKIAIAFLSLFLVLGCKNDKKSEEPQAEEQATEEKVESIDNFTVRLKAKVELDDQFRILYTEEDGEAFTGKKAIFKEVKGSNEFQIIEFKLKQPDIYPARLRLNVGFNKEQKPIEIEYLEMLHERSSFTIPYAEFKNYFFPNKYIEYRKETGTVNFLEDDGKHLPFFVSRGPLHKVLNEQF